MVLASLTQFLERTVWTVAGVSLTVEALLLGILVFILTGILASMASRAIKKMGEANDMPVGTRFALARIVRYTVLAFGAVLAANAMGLNLTALMAGSAVLLVGIGFGLQNIAQNFVSGLILLIEQPVRKGDFVKIKDHLGTVEDIGLRATRILLRDGVTLIVPNSDLITSAVLNHSSGWGRFRVQVKLGVVHHSNPMQVREILLEIAARHEEVLEEPPPQVVFEDIGASSLQFLLLAWITRPGDDVRIGSELRYQVARELAEAGIEVPVSPQETTLIGRK